MAFCTQCGAKLEDGVIFCTNCGARLPEVFAPAPVSPAAKQPAYTPPAASQGQRYSYDPTIGRSKRGGTKQKGGKIVFLLLAALVVVAALLFIFLGRGGGAGADDPMLGLYTAQKAELNGVNVSIDTMWENGFSIELQSRGRAELNVDGSRGDARWTLDGENLTLTGAGVDCSGTLRDGELTLENVMDTGVTLTFAREGGTIQPAATEKPAFSLFPEKEKTPFSDDPTAISQATMSVVKLNCFNKSGDLFCTGSGFCIFEEGTIVTNYHVISEGCYRIVAEKEDGQSFEIGTVVAYDAEKDIAILKTSAKPNLALLDYTTRQLQKGEKVVAIGSPLGLLNTVSAGVFSGYLEEDDIRLLQFTASVSGGSSGGPLFGNEGKVIGVTSSSFVNGQNLNFAVPIDDVVDLWESRLAYTPIKVSELYLETSEQAIYGWWTGNWYGWWSVVDAGGSYAEDYPGNCWDACAEIGSYGDGTGFIEIWDEDDDDIARVRVSFGPGLSDKGCMTSLEGTFLNGDITRGDWIVDPTDGMMARFGDVIVLHGIYAQPSNARNWIEYYIFLRPWGTRWEDVEAADTSRMPYSDMMPLNYYNWYLPLIKSGAEMPGHFDGLN